MTDRARELVPDCPVQEKRVAEAICLANGDELVCDNGFPNWARYRVDARAAIEALTPPEGDTVSEALLEATLARLNWQKYNDEPGDEIVYQAEKMASAIDKLKAALQSRVSPQAGMREALEAICAETGDRGDGFIDWQRCVDRIQQRARAALASTPAEPDEPSKRETHLKRWPLGDAGDAVDFACDHISDRFEAIGFLECWRGGDLEEWFDYLEWLNVQYAHRKAEPDTEGGE